MKISIIIPVFNEKQQLPELLERLLVVTAYGHEIIIVDGGSTEKYEPVDSVPGLKMLTAEKGRARQMNVGALHAEGEIFWFIHADSGFLYPLESYLRSLTELSERQWGRFNVRLDGNRRVYRLIEWMMNWRSSLSGIATGDQGIFVHRQLFNEAGCFSDIAIMEDIDLCKKLKKFSSPVIKKRCLTTSSRRWEQGGVLRTIFLMWKMRVLFFFGWDPDKLVKMYD